MDTDIIVFTALKLKKDNSSYLPKELCDWTNIDECSILRDLLERKFKRRAIMSMYYLNGYNYKVEDEKVKSQKSWDELVQDYIMCFSIDMLNAIFNNQEFIKEYLTKIIELYINGLQKSIDQAAVCLNRINDGGKKN